MNRRKQTTAEMYFLPEQLRKELARIHRYPLTLVEASSGFGKTTAVREYLKEDLTHTARQCWYTCLGEPPQKVWRGICELFGCIDQEVKENLLKLGMPTQETKDMLADMVLTLRRLRCQMETYLVVDNYQLFESDISRELINAFSMHGNTDLHLIFITQYLEKEQQTTVHNANIYTVIPTSFFFDKDSTAEVFRLAGLRLSNSDIDRVHASTEGWVSAIRLQMINFQETGTFQYTLGIEQLVETAIWNRLSKGEKSFFLSASILDSFTARQAAIMLGEKALPDNIAELLRTNAFIRYFPEKNVYVMHSILQGYLRNQFYNNKPEDFQKVMLHRAGQSFAAIQDYLPAAQFFYKVGDFDSLLSMPFNGEYLDNQKEKYLVEFVVALVENCPADTMRKYPFAMLVFAFQLLMSGQHEGFEKLCRLINEVIENPIGFTEEEIRRIQGELALVTSFIHYNNIEKMSLWNKIAWELLGGPTSFLRLTEPWTFGSPSVLYMFWSKTGELERELRCMEECIPLYSKLTRGHGTGADSMMRAEALLMRGEDGEAEVMCHRALYAGRSCKQTSLCLCAEMTLARIAILRGDGEGYQMAERNIRQYAKEKLEGYVVSTVDLCLATINFILGSPESDIRWLDDPEAMSKILYAPVIPYGQLIYGKQLLLEKHYNELYGISQMVMEMAKDMNYVLPQVYHLIYLAVAKHNTGNEMSAQKYLIEALKLALPDKVYLPFAEHGSVLSPLLEKAKLSVADRDGISTVLMLCKRQALGVHAVNKSFASVQSPLTPRERETALLAKERLSAKEIADRLFISEATVKTILKSVYIKLDIHKKSELNGKEF